MAEQKEIEALVNLLDDSDEEVVNHVTDKLLSYGREVITLLDDIPLDNLNMVHQKKIDHIKQKVHLEEVKGNLRQWAENGGKDLFEGAYLVACYRFPDLDKEELNRKIDRIKLDLWVELNKDLTPLEKIKKVNYIFYNVYRFRGDADDYHSPENSYINKVMDNRKGNPISLATIYAIICQRVGMPVYGVNLPQHFVLAYKDQDTFPDESSIQGYDYLEPSQEGKTLFYINAFNKGTVFSQWNIDQFLKQLSLEPEETYYEPCSNVHILMRVCRNLIYSYENLNDTHRSAEVGELLATLEEFA